MCLAMYGTPADCTLASQFLPGEEVCTFTSTEELTPALSKGAFTAIFILKDGADGMEGAIAARRQQPKLPLAWFSDDRNFAPQAYRLQADYFAPKPLTVEKLRLALLRCGLSDSNSESILMKREKEA